MAGEASTVDWDTLWRHDFELSGINTMRQRWKAGDVYTFRKTARPEHGLMYFLDCEAQYETGAGERIAGHSGDLFYMAKQAGYVIRFLKDPGPGFNCLLVNFQLRDETGADFSPAREVMKIEGMPAGEAEREMRRLNDFYYAPVPTPAQLKGALYQLLAAVSKRVGGGQWRDAGRLAPALEWLEKHYPEDIRMPALAALCEMSESGFRRRFTDYAGVSPLRYLLERRMDQARRLLKLPTVSVGEAAAAVGFDDQNYFSRLFRQMNGMTPGAFQKNSDLC